MNIKAVSASVGLNVSISNVIGGIEIEVNDYLKEKEKKGSKVL